MVKRALSIVILAFTGYYIYQNRYRVMNRILGNAILRRFAVRSLMGIPGVRDRMMKTIFTGPSDVKDL
ncbi:hypothetical protein [Bacillus sp. B15-48]|uniref:hypothetical protein n=1 Tax=Bacillus sp. B15-48 TaxID=1548601 RepID=UPI00193FC935|nr:hypothetical protein [Bacillus sp. B15-48]MBM4762291.1 hypothetical protein [Bacillus sp. B15-48]